MLVIWGGVLLAVLGLLLRYAGPLGFVVGRERSRVRTDETTAFLGANVLYAAAATVVAGVLVALVPALDADWFWACYVLFVVGLGVRALRGA